MFKALPIPTDLSRPQTQKEAGYSRIFTRPFNSGSRQGSRLHSNTNARASPPLNFTSTACASFCPSRSQHIWIVGKTADVNSWLKASVQKINLLRRLCGVFGCWFKVTVRPDLRHHHQKENAPRMRGVHPDKPRLSWNSMILQCRDNPR